MSALRVAAFGLLLCLGACTVAADPPRVTEASGGGPTSSPAPATTSPAPAASSPAPAASSPAPPTARPPAPTPPPATPAFDAQAAYAVVVELAGGIGPREATSPAFRRAADLVAARLTGFGYDVTRRPFTVPAGTSWGVRVPAGSSENVVATPKGFDPAAPHRLVGAHLDTVPQAPGAEDNASGVAVLLELARMAAASPPAVPVVFVAFGAEEPRGPGDTLHHFGSRELVASWPGLASGALTSMVSLDRVGVPAEAVPVCQGGRAAGNVQADLVASAARAGVPARACSDNRASDHWSFEKAGVDAARLGSVPYAGYHSGGDVPGVVDPAQLQRTGTLAWAWLGSPG